MATTASAIISPLRLLVCGGRSFADRDKLDHALDALHAAGPVGVVITGGAPGADRLAGDWALANELALNIFVANWRRHGNPAGPIRNRQMLDFGQPDRVIAFPGGKGTFDMVMQAQHAGVPVVEVD